ncbi:polyamine aminopropyltransferase [Nocardioides sp. Root140]|uniref:polyamine aminopropyltransferase n=1 Tax=Nocardioides sp. Root140 TaxID=1736460 RepID=UPI0022865E3E|nr:polyamine aminopropyltransferase [Nocardioides sp. Root140]
MPTLTADTTARPEAPVGRAMTVVVLVAVFICAACGLVYELALVTLGSYLLGSSITQTAIVISVTMFAMGLGALFAKQWLGRPLAAFLGVELGLALIGGFSVPLLYVAFAWLEFYTPAMVICALLIGMLIGAEIPLLMELLQRFRAQDPARAVANINAVDYIGALVGGLAFPFVLLPMLDLLIGTLVVAAFNVAAAWLVALVLLRGTGERRRLVSASLACGLVAVLLGGMAWKASEFEATARQLLYRDPIIHAERSAYQDIVVTRGAVTGPEHTDVRLFLDGDLQFSSVDEYRYHEMLVHPAMSGPHERVLVLGGGDGLALREILKYDDVDEVTLVDLDPAVVDLARSFEPISSLNEHSFEDPRVTRVAADAFSWVREQTGGDRRFDTIVVDFPDPDSTAIAKLYSEEFYGMLRPLMAPGGRTVVQSGSPFFAPDAFWCVRRTVAASGLSTVPYHAEVPSFGDWGFVLATEEPTTLSLDDEVPDGLRFVNDATLGAATVFPPDRAERDVQVSTLLDPVILEYTRSGWVGY